MKNYLLVTVGFVYLMISTGSLAQEHETGSRTFSFDWTKYLSATDRQDISRRIARADIETRIADGTLASEDGGSVQTSISGSLVPTKSLGGVTTRALSGLIDCDINTQTPHLGSGPGSTTVPKAKTSGDCDFTYTGPGAIPPTLTYELDQVLLGVYSSTSVGVWTETHARTGLDVTWSASSAQVFGSCDGSGYYYHTDIMWVVPPAGWTWTGDNPMAVGTPTNKYIDC